jgi:hypothetical protein
VLWSGARDCPVCHWTVFGAPGPYKVQAATLGFSQARSGIIHWTVRCASGQRLSARNVDCKSTDEVNSAAADVRAAEREMCPWSFLKCFGD